MWAAINGFCIYYLWFSFSLLQSPPYQLRTCVIVLCCSICTGIQGIGDSGQGVVNAVLFCLFTQKVRKKLYDCGLKQIVARITRKREDSYIQDPISLSGP